MRYAVTLERGGWVVWDTISRETVTRPATSEEAEEACDKLNAECVTRPVDPPVKVDGWTPAGELSFWLQAEGSWWGLVQGEKGVRWIRAEQLRPGGSQASPLHHD